MIAVIEIDDRKVELEIPLVVGEVEFGVWCDFKKAEEKYLAEEDSKQALFYLLDALEEVYGEEVREVPWMSKEESLVDLIDGGFMIRIGSELSVGRLYAHLVNLFRSYVPEEIPKDFVELGDGYEIRKEEAVRVMTERPLTLGEAVEVLEYKRRTDEDIARKPLERTNLDFTLGLTEFAILVRKRGERLPADPAERERFLEERRRKFFHLDMGTVLQVRFFFMSALIESEGIGIIKCFGKGRKRGVRFVKARSK